MAKLRILNMFLKTSCFKSYSRNSISKRRWMKLQHLKRRIASVIKETKSLDYIKKQIQAEALTSKTFLRHHSVQGTLIIRCYLQEL